MRLFSRDCAGTGKSGGTCCAAGMFGGGRLPFPSEPGKGTWLFVGAHRLRAETGARTFPFHSGRGGAHDPGKAARGGADGAKAGAWLLGRCGEGSRWYGTGRGRMSCGVGMWARFSRDGQGALPGGCFSYHADAPAVSARLPPRRKAGDGKGGFRQRQGLCLGMFPSEPGKGRGFLSEHIGSALRPGQGRFLSTAGEAARTIRGKRPAAGPTALRPGRGCSGVAVREVAGMERDGGV